MGNAKSTQRVVVPQVSIQATTSVTKPSYDELVAAEANRRIELEKHQQSALAEKKRFEEDVAEQIALAKNPEHTTREMMRQEGITCSLEETARTMDARLREQEKQKILEERAKAHEERQKLFQESVKQQHRIRRQAAEHMNREAMREHEERMRKREQDKEARRLMAERKKKEEAELAEKAEKERLEFQRDMKTYVDSVLEMMRAGLVYVSEYEPNTPERADESAKLEKYRKGLEEVARQDVFENKEDPAVFRYIVDYILRINFGIMYETMHPDDGGRNGMRGYIIGRIVECPSFGIAGIGPLCARAHDWNYKWLRLHHNSYCGNCKSCVFGRDTSVFQ